MSPEVEYIHHDPNAKQGFEANPLLVFEMEIRSDPAGNKSPLGRLSTKK